MFNKIKEFLFGKQTSVVTESEVPYKVESTIAPVVETTPKTEVPIKTEVTSPVCGCGRSPTGLCVGLHKLTNEEWAKHPDNKTVQAVTSVRPKRTSKPKDVTETIAAKPKKTTKKSEAAPAAMKVTKTAKSKKKTTS